MKIKDIIGSEETKVGDIPTKENTLEQKILDSLSTIELKTLITKHQFFLEQ